MKAEYRNGLAVIANGNRLSEVNVKMTAELVLKDGGMRPNKVDMHALAAGYLALLAEVNALTTGKLAANGAAHPKAGAL